MRSNHPGVSVRLQQRSAAHKRPAAQQRGGVRRRWSWLPFGLIGLGALLLMGLLVVSFGQAGAQMVIPPRVGAPLGNFTLTDIQGQKVQLSDYQGKVVLVNSWATWCPPCRAEMPTINAYYQAHQPDGFIVLAVNAGDPPASAASFAQSHHLAFPVLLDTDLHLLDGLGIHDFPTSIVVGRDGRVKYIQVGMFTPEALDSAVTPLLSQ
jgi:cytochrome c biogenesis protein CcmG, thiol:disulfide interchange protein DsbE